MKDEDRPEDKYPDGIFDEIGYEGSDEPLPPPEPLSPVDELVAWADLVAHHIIHSGASLEDGVAQILASTFADLQAVQRAREVSWRMQTPYGDPGYWRTASMIGLDQGEQLRRRRVTDEVLAALQERLQQGQPNGGSS